MSADFADDDASPAKYDGLKWIVQQNQVKLVFVTNEVHIGNVSFGTNREGYLLDIRDINTILIYIQNFVQYQNLAYMLYF